MGDTEPEQAISCNQKSLPVEGLGCQWSHVSSNLQFSCLQDVVWCWWQRNCGNGQEMTDQAWDPYHERDLTPTLSGGPGHRSLIAQRPRIEQNTTEKNQCNDIPLYS